MSTRAIHDDHHRDGEGGKLGRLKVAVRTAVLAAALFGPPVGALLHGGPPRPVETRPASADRVFDLPSAAAIVAPERDAPPIKRQDSPRATSVARDESLVLCQALGPAAPYDVRGVDCVGGQCNGHCWEGMGPIPWQAFGQGEYVGHARLAHVPEYLLRVDDELEFIFRVTRDEQPNPYELNVGDELRVESLLEQELNRDLLIQPDGTITLPLLGQVRATRRTVAQLRQEVEDAYKKYYKVAAITITPLKVDTKLEDLRATVDSRYGFGGQSRRAKVTPEGTVQLPAIGSVNAQGMTLDELRVEINARYVEIVEGFEITPVLVQRAPRYVYVVGEVREAGRFTLEGPTTVLQAISMAKGWNVGANLNQVVVFRRGDDWRLLATMLDLRAALYAKDPCPSDEIWLNDSDIVVVPKSPILVADDIINLVFTRGIYGVLPFSMTVSYTNLSSLGQN